MMIMIMITNDDAIIMMTMVRMRASYTSTSSPSRVMLSTHTCWKSLRCSRYRAPLFTLMMRTMMMTQIMMVMMVMMMIMMMMR